ncbi:MAG: MFS transporter [Treponema sp.]|jgi:predicted MFS family arabinose efflux permease|nr:MFS transporter [Treponema sp.]
MKKNGYLFACSFIFSLSLSILGFSLIYLLTDRLGFSPAKVGTYIALGSLCYFLCCNIYQHFCTHLMPQTIIPTAISICLLASILLALVRSPLIVGFAYCIIQGSSGFFWPPVMAWFTQGLNEEELNRDISRFNLCWMGGGLLGPLVGGVLYHVNSILNFLVIYACLVLVLYLLWRLSARHGESADSGAVVAGTGVEIPHAPVETGASLKAASVEAEKLESRRELLRERSLKLFKYRGWMSAFCGNAFSGILANIFPLYIRDVLGYTEGTAGMLLLFRGIAALAGFAVFARLKFWHFNRKWFVLIHGIVAVLALLFVFSGKNIFMYFIVIFITGFFYAGCYNNSIFHSSAEKKNTKANLALHEIFLSVGSMSGAFGGGLCYQRFGMGGTFFALSLILFAIAAINIILNRLENQAV